MEEKNFKKEKEIIKQFYNDQLEKEAKLRINCDKLIINNLKEFYECLVKNSHDNYLFEKVDQSINENKISLSRCQEECKVSFVDDKNKMTNCDIKCTTKFKNDLKMTINAFSK